MQVSLFIEFGNGRFRILGSVVFFLDDPVFFWDVVPSTRTGVPTASIPTTRDLDGDRPPSADQTRS